MDDAQKPKNALTKSRQDLPTHSASRSDDQARAEKAAHIVRLFAGFPSQDLTREERKIRSELYLEAVSGYTVEEVQEACKWWLEGKEGDGNENYAFAPSAPQLARLCEKRRYKYRIPPSSYPTMNAGYFYEPTPDEKERVTKGFEDLLKKLKAPKGRTWQDDLPELTEEELKRVDEATKK